MAEIYCKSCGQAIGPTAHKVGGPECVPSHPQQEEKKLTAKVKQTKEDRLD